MQKPNDSEEIRVRDLPRDEARALLQRIRADADARADEGQRKLAAERHEKREREEKRRAELRAQREALLKSEEGSTDGTL